MLVVRILEKRNKNIRKYKIHKTKIPTNLFVIKYNNIKYFKIFQNH